MGTKSTLYLASISATRPLSIIQATIGSPSRSKDMPTTVGSAAVA